MGQKITAQDGPSVSRARLPLDVLLIDASALNRSCFSAGLDGDRSIRLVACASVEDIIPASFERGGPDVIIMRPMGDEVSDDGVASKLQVLAEIFPPTATVLIVPDAQPHHVLMALRHAIVGLTTDELSISATVDVMRLVHAGMVVYPQRLFANVQDMFTDQITLESDDPRGSSINRLTPRQYEVLRLLAGGLPNKAIAQELGISGSTVKVHIRAIMERLGLVNRTQAAARFLKAQS